MKSYHFSSMSENVSGLIIELVYEHDSDKWRLFMDSSKTSLKAVLLHNGNVKPSIPNSLRCKHERDIRSHENLF